MNTAPPRISALDALRGFAVLGILLMNVVDFAMPGYAYYDPSYYGGSEGANFASWAVNYILFDGKMRGLFTVMFGASTVLIAERAFQTGESPFRITAARMWWLFVFGMIHAWFIWYGDILVLYSVCGMLAVAVWRWPPRRLLVIAAVLLGLKLVLGVSAYFSYTALERAASQSGASESTLSEWASAQEKMAVPTTESQLEGYRGSYWEAFKTRIPLTIYILTGAHPIAVPDTLALIAIGMALFKMGFFSGAWSVRSYQRIAIWSFAICVPLYFPLIAINVAADYHSMTLHFTEAIHLSLLRVPMTIGYAALVILFIQHYGKSLLAKRLTAAGRMAFTNYIGTSILCTLFFNGYGLGWYGYLERWQCYLVVIGVWVIILLWSKPWLDHFQFGPLEWLWRSLSRGRLQPFVKQRNTHFRSL